MTCAGDSRDTTCDMPAHITCLSCVLDFLRWKSRLEILDFTPKLRFAQRSHHMATTAEGNITPPMTHVSRLLEELKTNSAPVLHAVYRPEFEVVSW